MIGPCYLVTAEDIRNKQWEGHFLNINFKVMKLNIKTMK